MTLACYATICKETGRPFQFTGVPEQWNMLTEISDARLIARQLVWAGDGARSRQHCIQHRQWGCFPLAQHVGKAGRTFRPRCAGLRVPAAVAAGPHGGDAGPIWRDIAARHDLIEPDIGRLATWWHCDADFGRVVECISDMTRSRKAGFLDYQSSADTYLDLFRWLQTERIIPTY